jgi:hypothetical protein
MKKLFSLLAVLLIFSQFAFSQFDPEDAQLFGASRGANDVYANIIANDITSDVYTKDVAIKNTDMVDMHIVSVFLPQGVSVMLQKNVLAPSEEAKMTITINKNYLEKIEDDNSFVTYFTLRVREATNKGVVVNKSLTYRIVGQFK